MNSVTIYALADPNKPDEIRYIGKTIKPLHRRLGEHIAERRKSKLHHHRKNWISSLFISGLTPVIWPLEVCSSDNWQKREKYWISFFKPLGKLVNATDGGDGSAGHNGWKWSREALDRISAIRRSKPTTQTQLENLRLGRIKRVIGRVLKGRRVPLGAEERRKRRSDWARLHLKWPVGKPRPARSEESKRKMSEKMKGRKVTWVVRSELNKSITASIFKECNERRKKRVVGIETGKEFESIADAVRQLKCSYQGFREAIKNGWKCRGIHWRIEERKNKI